MAPERVPGLLVALEAGIDDAAVRLVHLRRAATRERERELVPGLARPVGSEAADDILAVEHEPGAVRHRRFDVPVLLREVDAEQRIEGARAVQVGADDADRVEVRHWPDANG